MINLGFIFNPTKSGIWTAVCTVFYAHCTSAQKKEMKTQIKQAFETNEEMDSLRPLLQIVQKKKSDFLIYTLVSYNIWVSYFKVIYNQTSKSHDYTYITENQEKMQYTRLSVFLKQVRFKTNVANRGSTVLTSQTTTKNINRRK